MRPSFSLGIEEEYQTIDPVTRDLRSHIQTEMLAQGKLRLQERVKAEMHTSVVEVGTRVCRNIDEAREDIYELRREMIKLARENGLILVAGATHPFADWRKQGIYPDPRYHQVVKDLQLVARANLIFGLHVHVGIEDREAAIRIMNSMRYFLPHIMALATNSPFWLGINTGYKGYRAKVFENFPRTGIPDADPDGALWQNGRAGGRGSVPGFGCGIVGVAREQPGRKIAAAQRVREGREVFGVDAGFFYLGHGSAPLKRL